MRIETVGLTDVGKARDHNEDFILVRDDIGLYVVCDGMGGHAGGEVASKTTAERIARELEAFVDAFGDDLTDSPEDRRRVRRFVREAVEKANREVFDLAKSSGKAGMGTTCTLMLLIDEERAVMAHVGDSRLYLLRNDDLHQVSDDHSYVREMVRRGLITEDAARSSPYSNVITRAVGIHTTVDVDVTIFDIAAGDTYLLCSDGLHGYFENDLDELGDIMRNDGLEPMAQQLINLANDRGGKDNISAVVVRARPEDDSTEAATVDLLRSTEINLRMETLKYVSMFQHLSTKQLMQVLEVMRVETCEADEVVIREGESGNSLFVILEGTLEVHKGDRTVATLETGSHFGEMALLNQRPRSATVKTKTAARLLVMDRKRFEELIKKEARLGVKLLWTFAQVLSLRLDEANT